MILVTGGLGYLGSHCVVELEKNGYEVVILDNLVNSDIKTLKKLNNILNKEISFVQSDIRDKLVLSKLFKEFSIDTIFHFAGLKSISESYKDPQNYFSVNVDGTSTLLEEMAKASVKRFVFSSSATVYGFKHAPPWKEDLKISMPSIPYSQTKYIIENILHYNYLNSKNKLSIAVLRYFNPIGAHESGLIGECSKNSSNLIPSIIDTLNGDNKALNIYGDDYDTLDGTGIRDYIHVFDLISGHIKALNFLVQNGGFNVWNLGSGMGYSVMEVVKKFEHISGKSIPLKLQPRRKGDLSQYWADISKAKLELKWTPNKNLDDMVIDTINYINQF